MKYRERPLIRKKIEKLLEEGHSLLELANGYYTLLGHKVFCGGSIPIQAKKMLQERKEENE